VHGRLVRSVDWWFAYNDLSRDTIVSLGFPPGRVTSVNNTIDTAGKYRLVFQTTDPSKRWVSYCLATSGNGNGIVTVSPNASSEDSVLYVQTATVASITAAMRGNASDDCPASGWATTQSMRSQYSRSGSSGAGAGVSDMPAA
jgi:hypothetical protein